jgi:PAS domain S-box-containing protein
MKNQLQHNQDELFRVLVESVNNYAIFALDTEGRIVSWNAGAERINGYRHDEIIGRHFSCFFSTEDIQAGKPDHELQEAAASERFEEEGWRVRKDGSRYLANVVVTALRGADGQLRGFAKVTRDITERRRLEEAKLQAERLALIGTMAAKVAHEIRNPLGSIRLNMDSVLEATEALAASGSGVSRELRALLQSIDSELRHLQRITDSYLQFARLPQTRRERVRLDEVLTQGLALSRSLVESQKVKLQTEFDSTLPAIEADRGQLWQAFLNLIRNAVDAMPDGGTLTVRTARMGNEAAISFADTGHGMTTEQQPQIFNPFFTTKDGGTGLGLTLTQQIISEHGGRIECASVAGKGTTFTIHLPLREEVAHEP